MVKGLSINFLLAWRCAAVALIYPITILAGLKSVVLVISSLCVGLESWSPAAALGNLALAFPAVVGVAAAWATTLLPFPWIARSRTRFVLSATGLFTGLVFECLFLKAELRHGAALVSSLRFQNLWIFGRPPACGVCQPVVDDQGKKQDQRGRRLRAPAGCSRSSPGGRDQLAASEPATVSVDNHQFIVIYSSPNFRSFCRSVARWMPICWAATARLPWQRPSTV